MFTRFLWHTYYWDSAGGRIKGSVCVCLYVCVYVYWGCMCKWRAGEGGGGLRQRNTTQAFVDSMLESAFVIHYDIFEKMLCMFHKAFFLNIRNFCFVHCCFATICCIIILENKCHLSCMKDMLNVWIVYFSQKLKLSAFNCYNNDLFM